MAELINEFEPEIESFVLIPSEGGRFEVTANDHLLFSKLESHRHVAPGEVAGLLRAYLLEAA